MNCMRRYTLYTSFLYFSLCVRWSPPLMQVFELGGDVVPPAMAANLTRLIAEGSGNGDAEADTAMQTEVVASYLDLLQKPKLSDVLLTVRSSQMLIMNSNSMSSQELARHSVRQAQLEATPGPGPGTSSCSGAPVCLCAGHTVGAGRVWRPGGHRAVRRAAGAEHPGRGAHAQRPRARLPAHGHGQAGSAGEPSCTQTLTCMPSTVSSNCPVFVITNMTGSRACVQRAVVQACYR